MSFIIFLLNYSVINENNIFFSFSNTFFPGQKLETSCGSLAYSAPEILIGNSYNATAVGKKKKIFTY